MAANLTPQYLKAEEQYRRAATAEEELRWLQVMLQEMPKHKASEKLQMDLKTKISKTREAAEVEKKSGKPSRGVKVPRQGAGSVLLIGPPNCGKSKLLSTITRASPEVADYPFTTREPIPGMMNYKNVLVQVVDLPPITRDFFESYIFNLVRSADSVVLMADLANDDCVDDLQAVLERFSTSKTKLDLTNHLDEDDIGVSYTATQFAPAKLDTPGAQDRLEMLKEFCPLPFPTWPHSAATGQGLEDLKKAIYESLGVIRVFSKPPNAKQPDREKPFTLRHGATVMDMAELIHKDLVKTLKGARVWGGSVHDGSNVKPDYVLSDEEVVELVT